MLQDEFRGADIYLWATQPQLECDKSQSQHIPILQQPRPSHKLSIRLLPVFRAIEQYTNITWYYQEKDQDLLNYHTTDCQQNDIVQTNLCLHQISFSPHNCMSHPLKHILSKCKQMPSLKQLTIFQRIALPDYIRRYRYHLQYRHTKDYCQYYGRFLLLKQLL